ncbi:MAG: DUF4465 domain-containing protein [Planctomycetia bacterium]|nr:DUF4465 domain-containing protein [Planctomycetia bacterium]
MLFHGLDRQRFILFTTCAVSGLGVPYGSPTHAETVTFESAAVRSVSLGSDFWVENDGFVTQGVGFSGQPYGGFVASQSTDLSGWGYFSVPTSPTAAEISAYANAPSRGGAGGSRTFAVASGSGTINLPAGSSVQSVEATNTATTFYSLRDGDQFAKAFGKVFDENAGQNGAWVEANLSDWFKVTFTGYAGASRTGEVTGNVDFYLADYRFADSSQDYIVQNWTNVDLTSLGQVGSIGIEFSSSDNSIYSGIAYMNTPAYVALDNLTLVAVPEPATLALAGCGIASAFIAGRRRTKPA